MNTKEFLKYCDGAFFGKRDHDIPNFTANKIHQQQSQHSHDRPMQNDYARMNAA